MASKKFNKGSPEWAMFQDYWKLCQQFWIPEDSDEWWENALFEINEFSKKYESEIFVRRISMDFIETLEEKMRIINSEIKK